MYTSETLYMSFATKALTGYSLLRAPCGAIIGQVKNEYAPAIVAGLNAGQQAIAA